MADNFNNPQKLGRFHQSSAIEIQSVRERRMELNTRQQTTWGTGVFVAWLQERNKSVAFEHLSPEALDQLLGTFYVEARQVSGVPYGKSALRCIRAAIQRHLQGDPWNRCLVITKDREFSRSNEILGGIFKVMTSEGRDKVSHHNPIEPGDMKKLVESSVIGTGNPMSLQRLVWLSLALHFGKRGSEGWRGMTKNTLVQSVDAEGKTFLEYSACEKQKNHPGDVGAASYRPEARVYARPGSPLCPVEAYNKYLSVLHPEICELWQKPNHHWKGPECFWYCRAPMGRKMLDTMLKRMSEEAQLSKLYTNHCLRATASKGLSDAGNERSDICVVTGHASVSSLDPYINRPSDAKKRKLSSNIGDLICKTAPAPVNVVNLVGDDVTIEEVLSQGCAEYEEDMALSQVASEAEAAEEDYALSQVTLEAEELAFSQPSRSTTDRVIATSRGQSIFTNCNIKNVTINIVKKK